MHSRRPLPALALVMPHPQLPTRSSLSHLPAHSPHTPRACTPSTPVLFPKQLVASPRTSIDSWGSSSGVGEDDVHWEWKPEQMNLLVRTLEALPGHLYTPFYGPVPPSNLLDKIARSVSQAQGPLEWPHSIRATRAKLIEIARARDKNRNKENLTIDEQDEDEVGEDHPGLPAKKPLYRQSSMDFLPLKDRGSGSISRLSSRLQRTDRIIPTYHPYARPSSRSPSPPTLPRRPETDEYDCTPVTPTFPPSTQRRALRSRTSSNSLGSHLPLPLPLRRSASAISTHSNPIPDSTLMSPLNMGILTSTKSTTMARTGRVRRSDSFSYTAPTQPTLKRAPSFGASSIAGAVLPANPTPPEKQPQDPETDDEEKARQTKVKRPRTRSTQASTPSDSTKKREKKTKVPKDNVSNTAAAKLPTRSKSQQRARSGSMFGAELPQPQPKSSVPRTSSKPPSLSAELKTPSRHASPSPPPSSSTGTKTLRRVKTTAFNFGQCPTARRISFGSLPAPAEEKARETVRATNDPEVVMVLGSAFQMA